MLAAFMLLTHCMAEGSDCRKRNSICRSLDCGVSCPQHSNSRFIREAMTNSANNGDDPPDDEPAGQDRSEVHREQDRNTLKQVVGLAAIGLPGVILTFLILRPVGFRPPIPVINLVLSIQ